MPVIHMLHVFDRVPASGGVDTEGDRQLLVSREDARWFRWP
jgi:hypothetical protein